MISLLFDVGTEGFTLVDWECITEKFFVYAWGSEPRLASRDPEFAKEVLLTSRAGDFGKARMNSLILEMVLGPDSVAVTQDVRRHDKHRQILNPFFYTEGLKVSLQSIRSVWVNFFVSELQSCGQ